jgi:TusA-related sulfurtransferase
MTTVVDARGLACPHPALLTRQALRRAGSGQVEVLVDTDTARENCLRVAEREGWQAEVIFEGSAYRLRLTR